MSHALHALSDVTFNFQSPDPQSISCFPRINPVSVPLHPNTHSSASSNASQPFTSTTVTANSGQPQFHVSPHNHSHVRGPQVAASMNPNLLQQNQQIRPPVFPQPFGVSFLKYSIKIGQLLGYCWYNFLYSTIPCVAYKIKSNYFPANIYFNFDIEYCVLCIKYSCSIIHCFDFAFCVFLFAYS